MPKDNTVLDSFALANTKKGMVTISRLEEPYGEKTQAVISIGISLQGEGSEPTWKAHIPYDNIDDLIASLTKIKNNA